MGLEVQGDLADRVDQVDRCILVLQGVQLHLVVPYTQALRVAQLLLGILEVLDMVVVVVVVEEEVVVDMVSRTWQQVEPRIHTFSSPRDYGI